LSESIGDKIERKQKDGGNTADQEEDVDSLLHSAIDIDQSIALEAASLQNNPRDSPSSTPVLGTPTEPRVDQEARRIEGKALRIGEILHKARRQLRRQNLDDESMR
jgi:hypothetical protein